MNELVLLHHNEPMTTSLAIAAGTKNEHGSVILLVKRYIDELQEFGKVAFEVAPAGISRFEISGRVLEVENPRNKRGLQTEFAFLNEPQSTLLITFMRNSAIVIRFKVALVKAFCDLRDRLTASPQATFPSHQADYAVAGARAFNAMMRAGRAMGLPLPQAALRANASALRRSGVDVMAEMGMTVEDLTPPEPEPKPDPVGEGVAAWIAGAGEGPWSMAEIAAEAFGMAPGSRKYIGLVVKIGPALKAAGFTSRKVRLDGHALRRYWERPGA